MSKHGYHATVGALKLFFEVVFPSLLPFFIVSDVLLSTGMVHYLGVWFEPLMRPIFNVPGVGSFVFSMGLAAGYPTDAVLTAKFRKQDLTRRRRVSGYWLFRTRQNRRFNYFGRKPL